VNSTQEIYLDTLSLMDSLKGYGSPKSKLTTMIKSGEVIQVRRGLYIPGGNVSYSVKTLANKIYGPSYISFEYALSYYGLIPERVENVTSAIFNKNKNKTFTTPLGAFIYRSIPAAAYPRNFVLLKEEGHPFFIATKEKALCDTLYRYRAITDYSHFTRLIMEDLRIDPDALKDFNRDVIEGLRTSYKRRIITLFASWMNKEFGNA
jgi:predicted transcriptional regulator of viral defense system